MQGLLRAVRAYQQSLKKAILQHSPSSSIFASSSSSMQHKGLENTTVEDVLTLKGSEENHGSGLWCQTNDSVHDAIKRMVQHNVGSLVVLKPGDKRLIAGILTERASKGSVFVPLIIDGPGLITDYLSKIAAEGRESKQTRVCDIMTEEDKLITVKSDTNIVQAMQLMTENHIRHIPVVDGKLIGMISLGDIARAVVEQQSGELKRLIEFIKGDYS